MEHWKYSLVYNKTLQKEKNQISILNNPEAVYVQLNK